MIDVFYQDDYVTLYCGDSINVIEENDFKFDLLLTDPPYGLDNSSSGTIAQERKHKKTYNSDFLDNEEYIKNVVSKVIQKSLNFCSRGIITPGNKNFCCYPQPTSFGTIYQPASVGLQKWGRCDAQPIFYYGRDPLVGLKIQSCSFECNEKPFTKKHPCSKPMRLWEKLYLRGSVSKTDVVFDPFAGSGLTGIIAKSKGRKAVLIELSREYCEIAVELIKNTTVSFDLDENDNIEKQEKQTDLFGGII